MAAFSFHWIDLLVVAIVIASAVFAVYRGFVAETLSIFAWAAAAFATLYFAPAAAPLLGSSMSPMAAQIVAYVAVFLVVLIPLSFMSARFSDNVQQSSVGPLDRSLGAVFGIVRGLILISLAYILFTLIVPVRKQPEWIADAFTLPLIQDTGDVLLSLVPDRGDHHFARDEPAYVPHPHKARVIHADYPRPRAKPATKEAAKSHNRPAKKAYGASERQGLDRLIQSTSGGGKKP
ncbi:MAG TPA: CvpA family protein [Rhizomicrobium sp.]|jgi:membrane protein required for colicin V production|nr:CvpA family protein [Rhizomicrobium sp.]